LKTLQFLQKNAVFQAFYKYFKEILREEITNKI